MSENNKITGITEEYEAGAVPADIQCSRSIDRIFKTIDESGMNLSKSLIYLSGNRVAVFGTPTPEEEIDDEDPTFYNALVDLIIAGAPESALIRAAGLIEDELKIVAKR
ncbi:hypothetical protein Osc1_23940 [Hominimerdicola sp. 21CYCFAH17_S]